MNNVSQLRSILNCTQAELGLLLGLHRTSIVRLESGVTKIAGPVAILLERYLAEAAVSPDAVRAEIDRARLAGLISVDPAGAPAGVDPPPVAPAGVASDAPAAPARRPAADAPVQPGREVA